MEELKDKGAGDASEVPEGEVSAGGKFRLTRRTMIIALSAFVVLALIIGGIFAYRASVQQAAAAAQKKERLAREAAAEAVAEAAERERAKAFAAESRRAHEALMAASPPAAELAPPPAKETDAQDGAKNSESAAKAPELVSESAKAASLKPTPDAELAKAASAPASKAAAPAKTLEVSAPTAVGGCTVSGARAEDYGKALGRCLEEFNRLEGRKP